MKNYASFVKQAEEQLVAEGKLTPTGDVATVEKQKSQITFRTAHLVHKVNPDIGLLLKKGGNNVKGIATDVLVDKSDWSWADVASVRDLSVDPWLGVAVGLYIDNAPDLSFAEPQPDGEPNRWVEPTLELADFAEATHVEPKPLPTDPTTGSAVFDQLAQLTALVRTLAIEKPAPSFPDYIGSIFGVGLTFRPKK